MTITILFFGELREQIGRASVTLPASETTTTVDDLVQTLVAQGEPWAKALTSEWPLQVAVNQEMAERDTPVPQGAEVAFFRPVTGG